MYFDWTDWFFFAQDDWRVTRRLTLNLGIRFELYTQPVDARDVGGGFLVSRYYLR